MYSQTAEAAKATACVREKENPRNQHQDKLKEIVKMGRYVIAVELSRLSLKRALVSHVAVAVLLRGLDLVYEVNTVILGTKARSVLVVLGTSKPAHLRSRHERFFFLCWRAKVNAGLRAHYSLNSKRTCHLLHARIRPLFGHNCKRV